MAETMATWLLHAGLEVGCPRCEDPLWVTGAEIIAQVSVTASKLGKLAPVIITRDDLVDPDVTDESD